MHDFNHAGETLENQIALAELGRGRSPRPCGEGRPMYFRLHWILAGWVEHIESDVSKHVCIVWDVFYEPLPMFQ